MSPLQAIMMVVESTRGHHFVHQFPRQPFSNNSSSSNPAPSKTSSPIQNNIDSPKNNGQDPYSQSIYETVLGFDTELLSNIFCPKHSLCNKKFKLTVDEYTFLGLPSLITESNSEYLTIPTNGVLSRNSSDHNLLLYQHDSALPSPVNPKNGHISPPTSAKSNTRNNSLTADTYYQHQTTMFNIIFCLKTSEVSENWINQFYNQVVSKFITALQYEQKRCNYVQQQTTTILNLVDDAHANRMAPDQLMEKLEVHSALARDISQLFSDITAQQVCYLAINDYLTLTLKAPIWYQTTDFFRDAVDDRRAYPSLRPHHALLLLSTKEEIFNSLSPDCSPLLIRLIHAISPNLSLSDLHELLDCSLAQIYRLSAHLIYWNKAKLIDVINLKNVYMVNPEVSFENLKELADKFSQQFPQFNLIQLLQGMNYPKPFSSLIQTNDARDKYLEIAEFLLRYRLVIQLHTYIYFMIPYHVKMGFDQGGSYMDTASGDHIPYHVPIDRTALASPPGQAGELEKEWIQRVVQTKPKEIRNLFFRCLKYFNGEFHVEEIIFNENLNRKEFRNLLNYFRQDLITVLHKTRDQE
jgi:hypothetical protein